MARKKILIIVAVIVLVASVRWGESAAFPVPRISSSPHQLIIACLVLLEMNAPPRRVAPKPVLTSSKSKRNLFVPRGFPAPIGLW
jgi:hypothetical protein